MAQQVFTITINPGVSITSGLPPIGEIGVPYSYQFTANGGNDDYLWTIIGGILPNGLTLNSVTGLLSGTPTGPPISSNVTISCVSI